MYFVNAYFVQTTHLKLNLDNNQKSTLDLNEIPTIEVATQKIFRELGIQPFSGNLNKRALSLVGTIQQLQDATAHSTRDKLVGLLKAAFLATATVAALLCGAGLIASLCIQSIAILIPVFLLAGLGLVATLGVAYCYSVYHGNLHQGNLQGFLKNFETLAEKSLPLFMFFLVATGPFLILHEALTRRSRLEKKESEEKTELTREFHERIAFYKEHATSLQEKLTSLKQTSEESLAAYKKTGLSEEGSLIKEQVKRQQEVTQALKDLTAGQAFYSKFLPTSNEG